MGSVEHDLAAHEIAMNAKQTANDLRVRELNEAYAEIGAMSGKALREVLHELDWPVWERVTELLAETMRDYPPEEARDRIFLATRAMRAFLAECMTEEA